MTSRQRKLAWALGILVVMWMIGTLIGPSAEYKKKYPRDGLTEEQYLEIAADCTKNPGAMRCK